MSTKSGQTLVLGAAGSLLEVAVADTDADGRALVVPVPPPF